MLRKHWRTDRHRRLLAVLAHDRGKNLMVPAVGFGFQRVAGTQVADVRHAVTLYPVATATGQRLSDNCERAASQISLRVFPDNHPAGWLAAGR